MIKISENLKVRTMNIIENNLDKLEKIAEAESHGTATIVDGVDTTITTYTTDKEINILHNVAKQKLAKQM